MKRFSAILAVAAIGLILPGTGAAAGQEDEKKEASWKDVTSKEGRFSIQFPKDPKTMNQTQETAAGPTEVHMFLAEAEGGLGALLSYNDYDAEKTEKSDPAAVLKGARDGTIRAMKGELKTDADIKIKGSPGKAFTFETKTGFFVTQRTYLVKNRLYQLMVLGPVKQQAEVGTMGKKFFESFKLSD